MRVGILTGGGDCPGLNPAIRGAVMRGLDFGFEMIGILDGWKGILEKTTVPLGLNDVREIIHLGGTILGTSRTNPFKDECTAKKTKENFRALGLDALIAIGGDDTLGAALKLTKEGYNVVGVPKTMDNDLSETDYTFGFDSAVSVAMDAVDRLRDTAKSHRRVMVMEVFGRHAGWTALFAGIAGGADWILIPEAPVDLDAMCAHIKAQFEPGGKQYAVVVVAEGVELGEEDDTGERDQFGHVILKHRQLGERIASIIKEKTGLETRAVVPSHIMRGGSPTLFDRMLGTRVGVKAAEMVRDGQFGMMAALRGLDVVAVPLEKAVGVYKTVPLEWYDLAKIFFK